MTTLGGPEAEDGRFGLLVPRMGQPGRNKWMFVAIWLVYLIGPILDVEGKHGDRSLAWKLLNWALVGAFIAGYCLLAFSSYPRDGVIGSITNREGIQLPLVLFLVAVATVLSTVVNHDFIALWVYVSAGIGFSLPLQGGVTMLAIPAAVAGLSVCCLIAGIDAGTWLTLALPTFFGGMATMGIRRMAMLIGDLREARAEVAKLATNEERLRLARDLHDLTGHSLSLITLKSELAQRMLERSLAAASEQGVEAPLTAKALAEIADIEQVSRQTLVDIREAVSNYRRPTLAVELSTASAALGAADIKLDADPSVTAISGTFDADAEAVLAWCLREAVTNVIRHSGATSVQVRLRETQGEKVLSVLNNGRGLMAAAGDEDADGADGGGNHGNGLRGLRERLDSVNGRLTVGGRDGDFRLTAAVPVTTQDEPSVAP